MRRQSSSVTRRAERSADPARPRQRRRRRRSGPGAHRGRRVYREAPGHQIDIPVSGNPANRHRAVGFTHEQWQYAFTNTPARRSPRRLRALRHSRLRGELFDSVLANVPAIETWVAYRNDDRAPLLFVPVLRIHIMPPKVQASNAKHYKSDTITEVRLYEGYAHLLPPRRAGGDRGLRPRWALEHA